MDGRPCFVKGCPNCGVYTIYISLQESKDAKPLEGRFGIYLCEGHADNFNLDTYLDWQIITNMFTRVRGSPPDRSLVKIRKERKERKERS